MMHICFELCTNTKVQHIEHSLKAAVQQIPQCTVMMCIVVKIYCASNGTVVSFAEFGCENSVTSQSDHKGQKFTTSPIGI